MNNKDISDSELINLANEESEEAKEILFEKYQYIINLIIKKYITASKKYNVEYNDLYQEALVGFTDAINRYNDTSSSLPTFITLCVDRRLQVIIKKASRLKNKIMNSSLSLEHVYDNYEQPLMDLLSDENKNNPLHNLEDDENCKVLINEIEKNLSSNEKEVFYLMLKNYNYLEIAEILNKTSKQIDNCIQRIKSKSKNIINKKPYQTLLVGFSVSSKFSNAYLHADITNLENVMFFPEIASSILFITSTWKRTVLFSVSFLDSINLNAIFTLPPYYLNYNT